MKKSVFKKKWAFKPTKRSVAEPEPEAPGPELFWLKPELNIFDLLRFPLLEKKTFAFKTILQYGLFEEV